MTVSVLDYNAGNVGSVIRMIEKSGGKAVKISSKEEILNSEKLIIPGVGSFDYGMGKLVERELISPLNQIKNKSIPILGICLGMQLMCNTSDEGNLSGLGWINANVIKFSSNSNLRVPHMGWNTINTVKSNFLFNKSEEELRFYFVHSYYVKCNDEGDVLSYTKYGSDFVSCFQKDNIYGVQFHPEKSHKFGMGLIKRFLSL